VSRWVDWHAAYDDPESPLSRRLVLVQQEIADAFDAMPPGPIRVISMCPGEARDLAGVLADHPRRLDVSGRVVELDPELARRARAALPDRIEVECGDASTTASYIGAVPADLVLVCGVFGNIMEADITRTIRALPSLCAPGAVVVWTRHRRPPDGTVVARDAFRAAGFDEVAFVAPDDFLFGVGVNRLAAEPAPFESGVEMFRFVGFDALNGRCVECGFVYDLTRAEICDRLNSEAESFVEQLEELGDADARQRPEPEVWSALEYACHVRDMLIVQRERVELIQGEDQPTLVPMGRDERVIEQGYNEQDPAAVGQELLGAARSLGELLTSLDSARWNRTGLYSYPTTELRSVEWIGNHTVHELQHHGHDVAAGVMAGSHPPA
jgi:hypothetical protein